MDTYHRKGPQGFTLSVVAYEIRGVCLDREVVWLHPARVCRCALQFQRGERDLRGFQYRTADPLKNSQVRFARAERVAGSTGEIARWGKTPLGREPSGVFFEGVREGRVGRRSPVILKGLWATNSASSEHSLTCVVGGFSLGEPTATPRFERRVRAVAPGVVLTS